MSQLWWDNPEFLTSIDIFELSILFLTLSQMPNSRTLPNWQSLQTTILNFENGTEFSERVENTVGKGEIVP